MKTVTIPLDSPIQGHRGPVTEIVLRPPRWGDMMGLGAPYTIHQDREGKPFIVYDEAVIAEYAERLVVEPKDTLVLTQVELTETIRVREAIVDFFLAAEKAAAGSTTSRKSSGSTSA